MGIAPVRQTRRRFDKPLSALLSKPLLFASLILFRLWGFIVFQEALLEPFLSAGDETPSQVPGQALAAGSPPGGSLGDGLLSGGFLGSNLLGNSPVPFWVLLTGVAALMCLLAAVFNNQSKLLFSRPWYPSLLTGLAVLGSICLLVWTEAPRSDWTLIWLVYGCGVVALGLAATGLRIELGRYFGYLGLRQTIYLTLASLSAALVLFIAAYQLPAIALWTLTLLLLPVALYLLRIDIRRLPQSRFYRILHEEKLNVPVKFIVTSLVQGFTFGVACCLLLLYPAFPLRGFLSSLGLSFALIFALASFILLRFDFNTLVYQVGFPLLACGALVAGLFAEWLDIGAMLIIAGFFYLEIILWALGAYLIGNQQKPAGWVILLPTFGLMAGRFLGGILIVLLGHRALPGEGNEPLWIIAAFCILVAALFMSNNVNLRYGWGFIKQEDAEEFQERIEACRLIAADAELTNRELEILILVAQGASRKAIAASLHVSLSTVKTHLLSLYRKLGLHTRDEVLRLIADTEQSFGVTEPETLATLDNPTTSYRDTTI
ncbi:MAG: helix-turn-helix transcriptional regulator [Coriobacteriales bacterium]|jgi:DNA-binding CsgD family transcriptional regulator|nr:helix-turn-helix transcriptional regulator [Coriobacteriales bacterium]